MGNLLITGFFTYQMSKIVGYHSLKNIYNGYNLPEKSITKITRIDNPYKIVINENDSIDIIKTKIDKKIDEIHKSMDSGFEFDMYIMDDDRENEIFKYIVDKGFYYNSFGSYVDVKMYKKFQLVY